MKSVAQQLSVVALTVVAATGLRTCLPDAIPEEQRINITISGASMPLRIVLANWDSSFILGEMFGILAGDVLGYNVEYGFSTASSNVLLQLAGCPEQGITTSFEDNCSAPSWAHFSFEIWERATLEPAWLAIMAALGEDAPVNLGSAGFPGYEGLFVQKEPHDSCRADRGLHLTYYGNYNKEWYNASDCLPTVQSVSSSALLDCSAVIDVHVPEAAQKYLDATGDTDGVEVRNGRTAFKCWQGKWWPAPSCRSSVESCISVVTGGVAWGFEIMAQQISFHNMPVALATADGWSNYVSVNMEARGALYWWSPDSTFAVRNPQIIVFPAYDEDEYERGLFQTSNEAQDLTKWAAPALDLAADRAYGLASNLKVSIQNAAAFLLMHVQKSGANASWTSWDTACQWLSDNPDSMDWVPDKTACAPGKGMVDGQGNFVTTPVAAADCTTCPAGRASLKGEGGSRVCAECLPGFAQKAFGAVTCDPCAQGSFSDSSGQVSCALCPLGSFGNSTALTSCYSCGEGEDLWTTSQVVTSRTGATQVIQVQGAVSDSFCSCSQGSFLWNGRCETCVTGSRCPGTNQLELLPGYFSSADAPGEVFRCPDVSYCPGGLPGTCSSGRDAQKVACSDCLDGLSAHTDGSCKLCDGGDYIIFVVILLAAFLGIALIHVGMIKDSQQKQADSMVIVVSSLAQLLTSVQMLAVVSRFGIEWKDPFAIVLRTVNVLSFNVEAVSLDCVTTAGPVVTFVLRALVMPVLILMSLAVHLLYLLVTRSFRRFKATQLLRTIGTLFMIFFIILFTMLLAPFQCNSHPNGRYTVQRYPSVFCDGQGEHLQLFVAGGIACLMPILFLAVCTWIVIVEIPRRVALSDVAFVDRVSFLVKRFRPGAEIFSVLFLLRNALVVLCPLAFAKSSKVLMMSTVLYANAILVSYYKPWRFPVCNMLDIILTCGLMLVLDLGSAVVDDVDPTTTSVIVTFFMVVMLLAILLTAGFGLYRYAQQKYRKQFKFFLCHQKAGAGSMARLLKMELEKLLRGTKTFVDCDDLNDLTRLFSYVGQDTETFVILGSPAIFTRKWCVGEMVTARRASVDSVILSWPELEMPNEDFIKNYPSLVPDINELTKYGIGLEEVRDTFRWLLDLEIQRVHDRMTIENVHSTVRSLAYRSTSQSWLTKQGTFASKLKLRSSNSRNSFDSKNSNNTTDLPILVDPDHMEAGACAHVLANLLRPKLLGTHVALPSLLHEGMEVGPNAKIALTICSENCFKSPHMQQWLLQCCDIPECAVIPVISEDGFSIPSPKSLHELSSSSLDGQQFKLYGLIIKCIFQEIAVVFVPQNYSSTHEDLELRAGKAATRLTAKLTPLADKVARMARVQTVVQHEDVEEPELENVEGRSEKNATALVEPVDYAQDPLEFEKL